ncbi:helicase-related protein, partial [Alicyclobacillus ferrooxydans]
AAYQVFHNELESVMRQQYAIGNANAFAKFIPSVVNAANQPHVSTTVTLGDDTVTFYAPNHERMLSAKEGKLLKDIQSELDQNRRCVVYVRYSGEAEQDRRIASVLKQNGIRVQTLQASVSPEERIEWLEQAVDKGTEVVVCNAKLVEVGLDLMFFPTLLFYQFTDEIATMRQASRRAWRIGQHRACKVFYYVYNGSYEMVQFRRMLQKRSHAMLLEGRLDKSEVSQFAVQDDKSASTFAIASCLGDVEDLS